MPWLPERDIPRKAETRRIQALSRLLAEYVRCRERFGATDHKRASEIERTLMKHGYVLEHRTRTAAKARVQEASHAT